MAFWTLAVMVVTLGWWLAGALMPFAKAVAACPSLGSLGKYLQVIRWVAASCRCRTHTVRFMISSARSISRVRLLSGWQCSAISSW